MFRAPWISRSAVIDSDTDGVPSIPAASTRLSYHTIFRCRPMIVCARATANRRPSANGKKNWHPDPPTTSPLIVAAKIKLLLSVCGAVLVLCQTDPELPTANRQTAAQFSRRGHLRNVVDPKESLNICETCQPVNTGRDLTTSCPRTHNYHDRHSTEGIQCDLQRTRGLT